VPDVPDVPVVPAVLVEIFELPLQPPPQPMTVNASTKVSRRMA